MTSPRLLPSTISASEENHVQRVTFVKPGRFIDRNQKDVLVVGDVNQIFEVSDDFAEFHAESVVIVPDVEETDDGSETDDKNDDALSRPRRRRKPKAPEPDEEDILG